ncbi:MAG TPA: hypothetical protein VFO19_13410, partial [Vicinamibacterales bacterium]|nr:hypothetical protein [Vicinamibacterales bacterium]
VRMALGARRGDVLAWVDADGLRLTAMSRVVGLAAAMLVAPALAAYLVGLPPLDVTAFTGASVLLAGVAALASYVPARRAAAVDPLVALRSD